jgi:hypothetical protein
MNTLSSVEQVGGTMLSHELLTELRQLNDADKLRVVQMLVNELAAEEEPMIVPGQESAIWSPYDAFEAAQVLKHALEEHKRNRLKLVQPARFP